MKKLSLVFVTLDYPPQRGGVARYLGNLVAASNGGIEVIVRDASSRWWALVPTCWSHRQRTLVISHVFPVGTAAWIARLFGGPEYVVLFHGLDLRMVKTDFKKKLLQNICSRAKVVLVNSLATGKELEQLAPGIPYTVLTPGVEERALPTKENARAKLGILPDAKLAVSVARLIPRKGIDAAIRAVAKIQQNGENDLEYVVIGDGRDRERLEGIAKESGTEVKWISDATDDQKWMWLAAADLFVLPVRDEGDDMEGFGIVYLEAALAGIPSVAGRSGGAPEAVLNGETGIVVDPSSEQAIEGAILSLTTNPDLKKRLGDAARRRVIEEFRWSTRWDTLKRLLES